MGLVKKEWIVKGRVQGVYYRAWACEKAELLALTGWVKNMPDGTVCVVAEGDKEILALFEEELKKGPPNARVTAVEEKGEEEIKEREFREFTIAY